jgi:hypothetical protein
MRRDTRNLVTASFAAVLGVVSVPLAASTEARAQGTAPLDQPVPAYNPYPPLPGYIPPAFSPPIYSQRHYGYGAKFKLFSRAISQSIRHYNCRLTRATRQHCTQTDMIQCGFLAVC